MGRDDSGAGIDVGGWGWLVGDDGGAAGLVREAVRAVLRARDVSQRDVVLQAALCRAAGGGSPPALASRMQAGAEAHWTAWAPAVFEAAESGSTVARGVVRAGVQDLVQMVLNVSRRGAHLGEVSAGVVSNSLYFARLLEAALATEAGSTLAVVEVAPVSGALSMAHELAAAVVP